jgi:hypothetical protein
MKKAVRIVTITTLIAMMSGCYGSMALSRKVHTWNGSLDNDVIKSVVFWGFVILPVYEATLFIDAVVLNTIEFFTGTNPVAIKSSTIHETIVSKNDNEYKVSIGNYRIHIEQIAGENPGEELTLILDTETDTWLMESAEGTREVARFHLQKNQVELIYPDGRRVEKTLM